MSRNWNALSITLGTNGRSSCILRNGNWWNAHTSHALESLAPRERARPSSRCPAPHISFGNTVTRPDRMRQDRIGDRFPHPGHSAWVYGPLRRVRRVGGGTAIRLSLSSAHRHFQENTFWRESLNLTRFI